MEKFFYELKPLFLAILGVYGIRSTESQVAFFSGLVLIIATAVICRWRLRYRYFPASRP